jgi:pyruvate formate lyase activating enzyme
MASWKDTSVPARLEEQLPNNIVRCHLSPRNCTLREGQHGFCGVRGNLGGRLVSYNYGKSVHLTQETIETEAVNHFAPGEPILSLGNIGCMLSCQYCHNWKTSQAKYLDDRDIYTYTPEQVVETARAHNIRVLSWTYNDPVVWHEFVRDTARLAQQAGMINLYKSAFFITPEAIEELLPVIDIFSISIKSIDPEYYRKYTSGWLQPVLDGAKQVYKAGKHLELSTLMITDISDNEETAGQVAQWILNELDSSVPVHFVRFHPDFKMRDTIRTPVDRLVRARERAIEMGLQHVYVGNVYDTPLSNSFCPGCNTLVVERYGLNASVRGLNAEGRCLNCDRDCHFKLLPENRSSIRSIPLRGDDYQVRRFEWHGDIRSIHVQVRNNAAASADVLHRRIAGDPGWRRVPLAANESYRFILAKATTDEVGCEIAIPPAVSSNLHEVFDRAHFPTVSVEEGKASSDISPLPLFPGQQLLTPARKQAAR